MKLVKTPGGSHTVAFGTTPITFELLYSARTTLALRVYPDCTVEVDAPADAQFPDIEAFIRRRGAWILRHLREVQDYAHKSSLLPRRYVSGESYRYLGRQYRLKVVEDHVERVCSLAGLAHRRCTKSRGHQTRAVIALELVSRTCSARVC